MKFTMLVQSFPIDKFPDNGSITRGGRGRQREAEGGGGRHSRVEASAGRGSFEGVWQRRLSSL